MKIGSPPAVMIRKYKNLSSIGSCVIEKINLSSI